MNLWKRLLNLLLPPRCIKCGKILSEKNALCADCFKQINFIGKPFCHCCGTPFKSEKNLKFAKKQLCANCLKQKRHLFSLQRSCFVYDDFSKSLIINLKFNDCTADAETLAAMLYNAGKDIWDDQPDILIPVPLHKKRLLKRKYNQSALLVKYLSARTFIKADYLSLIRQENTIPQVQLKGKARRNNLKHAFAVAKPQNIKNKKVVLVDDVMTTGSTLNECAKVLLKNGAAAVYSLTLARTED
ncbi:MAG: ComF family protein [Alphaproteobacteria bacterium]|nr:ComF family protein [Alphaproteobacteria bacterium]